MYGECHQEHLQRDDTEGFVGRIDSFYALPSAAVYEIPMTGGVGPPWIDFRGTCNSAYGA